jgi:hypothetical protein
MRTEGLSPAWVTEPEVATGRHCQVASSGPSHSGSIRRRSWPAGGIREERIWFEAFAAQRTHRQRPSQRLRTTDAA